MGKTVGTTISVKKRRKSNAVQDVPHSGSESGFEGTLKPDGVRRDTERSSEGKPASDSLSEQGLNKNDEFLVTFLSFERSPSWKYIVSIIENWKNQTLDEIISDKEKTPAKEATLKGEFKAYGRILNLPKFIIRDLQEKPEEPNLKDFDPFDVD